MLKRSLPLFADFFQKTSKCRFFSETVSRPGRESIGCVNIGGNFTLPPHVCMHRRNGGRIERGGKNNNETSTSKKIGKWQGRRGGKRRKGATFFPCENATPSPLPPPSDPSWKWHTKLPFALPHFRIRSAYLHYRRPFLKFGAASACMGSHKKRRIFSRGLSPPSFERARVESLAPPSS